MKNRPNFIPKSYNLEPDYYRECFGCWNAVYEAADGGEYMIELNAHFPDYNVANTCSILRQDEDCRRAVYPDCKTLREAVNAMKTILDNIELKEEDKKFHSEFKDALQKECCFQDAWKTIYPVDIGSLVSGDRPASEVGYSRWDYDGYRWWRTYWSVHDRLKTENVRDEINRVSKQFEKEFPTLDSVRIFCKNGFAEQKSNDTYDAFMVGEHCCFWFRFILRRGDYNLYLHTYSKEELRKEGIEL